MVRYADSIPKSEIRPRLASGDQSDREALATPPVVRKNVTGCHTAGYSSHNHAENHPRFYLCLAGPNDFLHVAFT
jgi:hypothetical protein